MQNQALGQMKTLKEGESILKKLKDNNSNQKQQANIES